MLKLKNFAFVFTKFSSLKLDIFFSCVFINVFVLLINLPEQIYGKSSIFTNITYTMLLVTIIGNVLQMMQGILIQSFGITKRAA